MLATKVRKEIWRVRPDQTVFEALQLMADKNVGGLPVMEGEALVGFFSERDYARKGILQDRTARQTRIAEVMSLAPVSVGLKDQVDGCMRLMTDRRVRHLPVLDQGRLVGILSIGDLVMHIISDQQAHIENLEQYISGY